MKIKFSVVFADDFYFLEDEMDFNKMKSVNLKNQIFKLSFFVNQMGET